MLNKIHNKDNALGKRLRAARESAGLSQVRLAEKIHAAASSVMRWEWGEIAPRESVLKAIARACKVPISTFTSAIKSKTKPDANSAELIKAEIAKRLRFLRGRMLQRDFAKKIGITPRAYLRYESGERHLRDFQLRNICEICRVSADWLLFGKERGKRVK
jgi:transcriptional regulator with XRE-family HTH domain